MNGGKASAGRGRGEWPAPGRGATGTVVRTTMPAIHVCAGLWRAPLLLAHLAGTSANTGRTPGATSCNTNKAVTVAAATRPVRATLAAQAGRGGIMNGGVKPRERASGPTQESESKGIAGSAHSSPPVFFLSPPVPPPVGRRPPPSLTEGLHTHAPAGRGRTAFSFPLSKCQTPTPPSWPSRPPCRPPPRPPCRACCPCPGGGGRGRPTTPPRRSPCRSSTRR